MQSKDEIDLLDLYLIYPRLTVMVGSQCQGKQNLMPAVWHTPVSGNPPLYSVIISKKRFSFDCITAGNGFTVNFIDLDSAHLSEAAGFSTGAQTDKLSEFKVETVENTLGFGPVMKRAFCALECQLHHVMEQGDHHVFIGLVKRVHWNPELTRTYQGKHLLKPEAKPLLYAGRGIYCTWDPDSFQEHRA